jgi:transcription elongation factor Elf1
MELTRTVPFKDHDDIENRTYTCPKCGHAEEWVVKEL